MAGEKQQHREEKIHRDEIALVVFRAVLFFTDACREQSLLLSLRKLNLMQLSDVQFQYLHHFIVEEFSMLRVDLICISFYINNTGMHIQFMHPS